MGPRGRTGLAALPRSHDPADSLRQSASAGAPFPRRSRCVGRQDRRLGAAFAEARYPSGPWCCWYARHPSRPARHRQAETPPPVTRALQGAVSAGEGRCILRGGCNWLVRETKDLGRYNEMRCTVSYVMHRLSVFWQLPKTLHMYVHCEC